MSALRNDSASHKLAHLNDGNAIFLENLFSTNIYPKQFAYGISISYKEQVRYQTALCFIAGKF